MLFDLDKSYNDPLLPPKAELETKGVLRKAIVSNKALGELKGAGDLIPKQSVLITRFEVAPICSRDSMSCAYVQKTRFLDVSQERVQGVGMVLSMRDFSLWRDIDIAPDRTGFVARFPVSRHKPKFAP